MEKRQREREAEELSYEKNKRVIKRERKFGRTYWIQRGKKEGRFLERQNMLIWYLSELEAQEPRHVSHGHGVEVSASFKGPRSLVFFLGSIKRLTCRMCSRLRCYYILTQ